MYLAISVLGLAIGAAGVVFGMWQRQRAAVLREQLIAFHRAGMEKDKMLEQALDNYERAQKLVEEWEKTAKEEHEAAEKWMNAAKAARHNALLEVENLLNYNGTGAGQHEITE